MSETIGMTLSIKHPKEKMERKEKIVRGEERREREEKGRWEGAEEQHSLEMKDT